MAIIQSVKHSGSVRQFCMVLLYDDRDIGADFTDLPDVNSRKDNGTIAVEFELSPYSCSCYHPEFRN